MSKHTEGPWEYLSSGNGSCGAITSKTGWVCDFVDNPSPEDARLIAAAPELLETLIFARKMMIANDLLPSNMPNTFEKIDEVIAEAKGEE